LFKFIKKKDYLREDDLDPLPYTQAWPSLQSAFGRVDIHSLVSFFLQSSKITDPYIEFGTASGRSAVSALRSWKRVYGNQLPKFFFFDSFEGLPSLEGVDLGSVQFQKGDYSFSKEYFINTLKRYNVWDEKSIHLIEGFYEMTLPHFDFQNYGISKVGAVHVDCDLHSSTVQVLDFITSYIQVGTILLFDDWDCFSASDNHGERLAVKEWLNKNQNISLDSYASYGWHGKCFVVTTC
jgi:O-methyltransferase